MTGWDMLAAELDRWGDAGRRATLWWRDDDAADTGDAVDRLFGLAGDTGTALALAVIPARATRRLAARAGAASGISILQHGFRHENHETTGRKAELGSARPLDDVARQLTEGRETMAAMFRAPLPVLVPPWNRISAALLARLPAIGFAGVSCFGPRPSRCAADGVTAVNTHADIIDWRGSRGFLGDKVALDAVVSHLVARRTGACDAGEPTGLLTHHLVHDRACWRFVERFLRHTTGHGAACWLPGDVVFGAG